eukprot:189276_1
MASKLLKEGWLKRNSWFGYFTERWVVITFNHLIIYKTQKKQERTDFLDTEELDTISSTQNDSVICIKTNDKNCIYFKCDNSAEKQEWINNIKILLNCIKIPVNIECKRNAGYQCQFEWNV